MRTFRIAVLAATIAILVSVGVRAQGGEASPQYPSYQAIPQEFSKGLAQFEIEIGAEQKQIPDGAISLKEATDFARVSLGLAPDVVAVSATIADVTTHRYGEQLESDPQKPSRIEPAIDHQSAWVVTFRDAPVPALGRADNPELGGWYKSQSIVFVDARSETFLYAVSY